VRFGSYARLLEFTRLEHAGTKKAEWLGGSIEPEALICLTRDAIRVLIRLDCSSTRLGI